MPSSGVGGPCDHCGRTQSCCWRRGPAQKPCLCNACGSRYLVKKNLDGYVPIVQRSTVSNKSPKATKPKSRQTTVGAQISKPRRTGTRRVLDSTTWYSDQVDSEEDSYITDDSVGPITNLQQQNAAAVATAAAAVGPDSIDNDNVRPRPANRPSLLGDSSRSNVIRVNMEREVQVMGGDVYGQLKVALKNSLRVKPRKPLNPTITAVY